MLDDEVRLLYVEYSFLGYRGADMETESITKPKTIKEPLTYNFKRSNAVNRRTIDVCIKKRNNICNVLQYFR